MRRSVHALSTVLFFFNDTATTEIYTLSLHDALPISPAAPGAYPPWPRSFWSPPAQKALSPAPVSTTDRKSTRLNSSHSQISYAVFCLKKKKVAPADLTQTHAGR